MLNLDTPISEMKRDALLAFYLKTIVPQQTQLAGRQLETPDDLYEYLLIDPEITLQVSSSPVASAIASLQTFISGVSLNRELPLRLTADQRKDWQQVYHQYPIWSANIQLSIYPENYIDPSLRTFKTNLFEALETSLNQVQLTDDSVQAAVFDYLNEFEKVSNLVIVNGYQDHYATMDSTVYLVGRTRIQPYEYYWRKVDMRQHDPNNFTIYPNAWSAWKKIELPIVDAVQSIVRPVFFKERLFVVWLEIKAEAEKTTDKPVTQTEKDNTGQGKPSVNQLHLKLGFKRFDDSWSPVQDYELDTQIKPSEVTPPEQKRKLLAKEGDTNNSGISSAQIDHLAVAEARLESNRSTIIYIELFIKGGKEGVRFFYTIDELLSFSYLAAGAAHLPTPLDERGKISIAKPLTHFSYAVKNPKQRVPAKQGGSFFIVTTEIVRGVKSNTAALHVFLENDRQIQRCQGNNPDFCGSLTATSTPTESGRINTPKDMFGLWYSQEKIEEIIEKGGLEINCSWRSLAESAESLPITIDLVKIAEYKESPAYVDEDKGIQRLHFQSEAQTDADGKPEPTALGPFEIRLNTLFARELIRLANRSLDVLLELYSQFFHPELLDPPAVREAEEEEEGEGDSTPIDLKHPDLDFYGANGLYFWELFFYMPFLVAYKLNLQQNFELATKWFNYLFDPLHGVDFCWGVKVLLQEANPEAAVGTQLTNPTDPDYIAMAHPVHYRKALFLRYVQNLIDQGDALYRQLTPDSLTEAKSYYLLASDLLGPRPDNSLNNYWKPIRLKEVPVEKNVDLMAFEQQFEEKMNANFFMPSFNSVLSNDPTIPMLALSLFSKPINKQLFQCWDTLASRLYNLRHNLSINGAPLYLPLFAAPLNPSDLLAQRNQGQGLNSNIGMPTIERPYYRFAVLINKAQNAVESLIQFGSTLMSLYERRDNRQWETLQAQQQKALLEFTISIQKESIALSNASNDALDISKKAVSKRIDYYQGLIDVGLLKNESAALDLLSGAAATFGLATPMSAIGAGLDLAPNIFGLADGGSRWGAPLQAAGAAFINTSFTLSTSASALQMRAEYDRRKEEWQFQKDLADSDNDLIKQQLAAGKNQVTIAETQLTQLQTQQTQIQEMLNFFATRFSNQALYQWLLGQLSALYFQAYDAVTSLCLAAEAAWRYEIGDFKARFIRPDAWNDFYHGLLAGETLKLYLQRMDGQYLQRNERRFEITKTISLKQLVTAEQFNDLKTKGTIDFDVSEKNYSTDYPGHYLRQITAVSIFLPAVVGPYQDVRATLTQTKNALLTADDTTAFDLLWNNTTGNAGNNDNITRDLRARPGITLSTGFDDSGLFILNFGDDRYLPFERTGAISSWTLAFPNPSSDEQKAILNSLTDVIIKIRYTAKQGNVEFTKHVEDCVKNGHAKNQKALDTDAKKTNDKALDTEVKETKDKEKEPSSLTSFLASFE